MFGAATTGAVGETLELSGAACVGMALEPSGAACVGWTGAGDEIAGLAMIACAECGGRWVLTGASTKEPTTAELATAPIAVATSTIDTVSRKLVARSEPPHAEKKFPVSRISPAPSVADERVPKY